MWIRGVALEEERVAAWWAALDPWIQEAANVLSQGSGIAFEAADCDLAAVRVTDVATAFGFDEAPGTAIYSMLTGDTQGLLMLAVDLPAIKALDVANGMFAALARGLGGIVEEPWALVDMRSTLAETLAAQTGCLTLEVMASIELLGNEGQLATLLFIPDWARWNARWTLEASREAA